MDLHVWEEIPAPKSIEERLQEVDAMLKHIDEKTLHGVWSREVEVKGCWLDVKEELECLQAMGDKDYLEFNYGTDAEPKIGRMPKSMCTERIDYKLDTYYGTTNMDKAMEIEYSTPGTTMIDVHLMEVDAVLKHIEEKTPKGRISRESECYGCWLDVKNELETLQVMGNKNELEFEFEDDNGNTRTAVLRKEQCVDRINYKLDTYYGTTDLKEALKMEYETPAPKDLNKNKGRGGDAR